MHIDIDLADSISVYEQIVTQVKRAIIDNNLMPGTPLPSIRQLANDLELNPNTVAKAYQILERGQIIFTAGRKGTFIHKNARENTSDNLNASLRTKAKDLIEFGLDAGISVQKIKQIINEEIKLGENR